MKFILCDCKDFNTFPFIFKGAINKLKLGFWLYSIILFLMLNISFKVSNLAFAPFFGTKQRKGFLNIIENIVAWYEFVTTALQLFIPYKNFKTVLFSLRLRL